MRQIDADALKARFVPKQCYFTEAILNKIDTAPTIEPQAARLMTLDEVKQLPVGAVVWREYKWTDEDDRTIHAVIAPAMRSVCCGVPVLTDGESQEPLANLAPANGTDIDAERYWTERPTDEQRKAVQWNE